MGIINEYKETLKKEVKPHLSIKGIIADAKEQGDLKANKKGPSVSSHVDHSEFKKRYKAISFAFYVGLITVLICVLQVIFSPDIISIIFCLLVTAISSMFTFRYSFTAWRARQAYKNWEERNIDKGYYYSDFLNDVGINYKNIFPISLEDNKK
jgi:K+-sensing histidine kinase KdpD